MNFAFLHFCTLQFLHFALCTFEYRELEQSLIARLNAELKNNAIESIIRPI